MKWKSENTLIINFAKLLLPFLKSQKWTKNKYIIKKRSIHCVTLDFQTHFSDTARFIFSNALLISMQNIFRLASEILFPAAN